MKKIKRFFNITALALGVVFVLQGKGNSGAWFMTSVNLDQEITASTKGAYYEKGEGTKDKPYSIKSAYHLYNLAWLQYLGYYDDQPYYFKLSDGLTGNLDMSGYTLPPIGTVNHPFISFFDGNGKTITNATFSNNYTDFNRHPFTVTESSFNDGSTKTTVKTSRNPTAGKVEIVGMFGVVGPYSGENTYDSRTRQIDDFKLDGVKIRAVTDNALVGALAGYVNSEIQNVAVNNIDIKVGTNSKAITTLNGEANSNISNYSTIGYCTENYRSSRYENVTNVYDPYQADPIQFNAEESGQSAGWGGSIDMKTMYNNLRTKFLASSKYTETYVYMDEQTRKDNGDGTYTPETGYTKLPSKTDTFTDADSKNGIVKDYLYVYTDTGKKDDNTSVQTASYTFSSDYSYYNRKNDPYVGLSGRQTLGTYDYTYRTSTTKDMTGFYLLDTAENVYLTYSGYISYSTSQTNDGIWFLDDSNHLYTNYNGKIVYLNASGTSLVTGESAGTVWEWDETRNLFKTGNYYLVYQNDKWTLSRNTSYTIPYYYISRNGYYLTYDSSMSCTATYGNTNKTKWYSDSNGYVYTIIDGVKYYISLYYSNYSYTLRLVPTVSDECLQFQDQTLYNSSYRRYLSINGTTVTADRLGWFDDSQTLTMDYHSETKTNSEKRTETQSTLYLYDDVVTQRTHDSIDTYFPLTWAKGSTDTPAANNTGYVIGGANYDGSDYGRSIGDVRIASYYTTSMLYNSMSDKNKNNRYDKSKFFAYSFDGSGNLVKIGDDINNLRSTSGYTDYSTLGFEKYYNESHQSGSRVGLDDMISGATAYGLHFMNAKISTANTIRVPYTKINGVEYENYQLPQDAIDFNLKTDGFVNFFAHTAYMNNSWNNSNNCFFSLNWINRNGSEIKEIKEIAKIYKNANYSSSNPMAPRYVYTYRTSEGKEDLASLNTGVKGSDGAIIKGAKGDLVFDTWWITDPEKSKFMDHAAYYFEIPINKGEYALGSSSGQTDTHRGWPFAYTKNGAYLMYLDIGANANTIFRTTVYEKIEEINTYFSFPNGVALTTVTPTNDGSEVKATDSICAVITGGNGTGADDKGFSFSREGNVVTFKGVTNYSPTAQSYLSYAGGSLNVGNLEKHGDKIETTTIERMTYFDFSTSTSQNTKTVISSTTYSENQNKDAESSIDTYLYDSGTSSYVENTKDVPIYSDHNTDDGVLKTGVEVTTDAGKAALVGIAESGYDENVSNQNIILSFNYLTEAGNDVTQTYLLEAGPTSAADGSQTITVNGYSITVEHENGGIQVSVSVSKKDTSMTIKINGTTIVAAGNPTKILSTELPSTNP